MTKTRTFTFVLRLLALAATLAATIVMATDHDSANVFNMTVTAKYSDAPAFKYFVIAEAIASGYNLVILLLASRGSLCRMVIVLDMVVAMFLSSSLSAAWAIAHVGKHGNTPAGWLPICGQVPKFCDHVLGALISGLIAATLHLMLLLYTLYAALNPLFVVKPPNSIDINTSS